MQNDISQFVVNIIPLQNIQTNISGVDQVTALTNAVANIQEMVRYDTKTIATDAIQSYTANQAINVLSPLNLSNVGLQTNGIDTSIGGGGNGTTLGGGDTKITVSTGQIQFEVYSTVSLTLTSNAGVFSGIVYAQNYVTLSDSRAKSGIEEIQGDIVGKMANLHPYEYNYRGEDRRVIGLLAEEVKKEFPLAVITGAKGEDYVNYDALVGYLVGAIKQLKKEIDELKQINLNN